ncbi:hypothetical protein EOJ36_01340 [Sandaracinomonas limnophila]|uniref:Uncharacterized protein n=1 Tax=Sandaracinomonas limnophila TaxID=1862386 RepID=A0A437PWT2_9BACT|nr:hypothetical protein [Sandaracinomonas limnophila]RVU26668.1 hypothetical protein EOJ36_01340 [Sandaracinomonas limnophila]
MIQKQFKKVYLLGFALVFFSCGKNLQPNTYYSKNPKDGSLETHSGLGFQVPLKYDIDIFFATDQEKPKTSYTDIETISISGEEPLQNKQTANGKMLYIGNSNVKKKELLDQLVQQAIDKGATALMDIKYQVYTSQTSTGYTFTGKAIRYVLK